MSERPPRISFEATRLLSGVELPPEPAGGNLKDRSFMQTAFWARFKAATGWWAFALKVSLPGSDFRDTVIVLGRPLALGQWFAYLPHGPSLCPPGIEPADYLASIAECITPLLPRNPLFVRFDIPWEKNRPESLALADSAASRYRGLRKGEAVQVPDTTVLDLSSSETELLERMKPKWRYNIRLAEKKGIVVTRHGAEALDVFYGLYLTTEKRDGIAIHPKSYYARLLEVGKNYQADNSALESPVAVWLARHEGEALAGIITIFMEGQAIYLYGASSDNKRNLMPAYALQWAAIRAAKASGCAQYDFFGIPPEEDRGHAMAGLYLFKTGFGGRLVHRLGSVDLPMKPLASSAFFFLEKVRLYWHKKVVKKISLFLRSIRSKA